MSENRTIKIGEILLQEGLITESNLNEALQAQKSDGRKLGEILVAKGFVTEIQVAHTLANVYSLPYVDLSQININDSIHGVVPADILRKYKLLPIQLEENCLTVATNNPLDVAAFQEIQYMTGHTVEPVIAALSDIEKHLDKYADAMHTSQSLKRTVVEGVEETPVVNFVEALITRAIKEKVSDIHLEPMQDKMRVRFRIDGVLYEKAPVAKDLERKVLSRIKILSGMDVADSRRPQDGRLTPEENPDYDIRVSTLPDVMGENMVMRILDKSYTNYNFTSLGMDAEEIEVLKRVVTQPHGIILLTGPTGAGKTTTLYSILNSINDISKNIITVEDPVEYKIPGITQTAINNQAGYTFVKAIRHILRHDPDVILIGEIRDQETADIAIRAALTGHLVFSTLHTNSAAGAIMRLTEMGIEPFLLRSSLIAVIAQRLVRRLCDKCKQQYKPEPEVIATMKKFVNVADDAMLVKPSQCEHCHKTGYMGRSAIYESLVMNEDIRRLILQSPNESDITKMAAQHGMKTLKQAGLYKAIKQQTSLDEVMRVTFTEEE
jgi:type IV pilus assembly protein PilB